VGWRERPARPWPKHLPHLPGEGNRAPVRIRLPWCEESKIAGEDALSDVGGKGKRKKGEKPRMESHHSEGSHKGITHPGKRRAFPG